MTDFHFVSGPATDALATFEFPCDLLLNRSHEPEVNVENVLRVLKCIGARIRLEEFSQKIVCAGMPEEAGHFPDGEWSDAHTIEFSAMCQRNKLNVAPASVAQAIVAHAQRHSYNALTDYANQCAGEWDGTPRVDGALTTYWHAEDTEATRISSRVFLLSLAARALRPGCKQDVCVSLYGGQGAKKSSSFKALVGEQWCSDSDLDISSKDGQQSLPGNWIVEFGEHAVSTKHDAKVVKAFLSKQDDRYRPSYGRFTVRVPRQTCFVGSTNEMEFLTDATGNRRFAVVTVPDDVDVDLAGIRRDRVQLIGEAAARVLHALSLADDEAREASGHHWWITRSENAILDGVREQHTERDPWESLIDNWIWERSTERGERYGAVLAFGRPGETADECFARAEAWLEERDPPETICIDDVFHWAPVERDKDGAIVGGPTGAVPLPEGQRHAGNARRAAQVLRRLGWERRRCSGGSRRNQWLWYRAASRLAPHAPDGR